MPIYETEFLRFNLVIYTDSTAYHANNNSEYVLYYSRYPDILGPNHCAREQLVGLIDRLVEGSPTVFSQVTTTDAVIATADVNEVNTSSTSSSREKEFHKATSSSHSPPPSSSTPAPSTSTPATIRFGPGIQNSHSCSDNNKGTTAEESTLHNKWGDLNKASDAEVERAKREMDVLFDANRKKPDDPSYVHDVRIDFEPADEDNDWDEESD